MPEEVDDQLKLLFARLIAHFIHSIEINVSVSLEFRQHGVEMPSTLKFLPESLHFGMQVLEIFWMSAICHRLINLLPQLIPGQRLTHAGSRLTCAGSRLTCAGSQLIPEEVDDQLKRLFALFIAHFISLCKKIGSVILES